MPKRINLPSSASAADTLADGRLHAPSAERNAPAIAQILREYGPQSGKAFEIASGTGQHAVEFATALPGLTWQPTEVDADRRASVDAWAAQAALGNLRPALHLDATSPGWGAQYPGQNMILLVNLLHLISATEAQVLITEASRALAPGGRFILYGPFLRNGTATSEGDRRFHASLQASDAEIGYKNTTDVQSWLRAAGLTLIATVAMPANNLILVSERSSETP